MSHLSWMMSFQKRALGEAATESRMTPSASPEENRYRFGCGRQVRGGATVPCFPRLGKACYFGAEKRLSNELACTIGCEPALVEGCAGAGAGAAAVSVGG